jgi:prepilin-type N-terminal cleavage/methylation domain-containing protein
MADPRARQQGLTLIELLITLGIVAGAIAGLQYSASRANRMAVETNHVRIAKMLLKKKAEEVFAGVETSSGGSFEGYPEAFTWSASETTVPLDTSGENQTAVVRLVTVEVRYPTLAADEQRDLSDLPLELDPSAVDAPGQMRVTMLLDPPEEQ